MSVVYTPTGMMEVVLRRVVGLIAGGRFQAPGAAALVLTLTVPTAASLLSGCGGSSGGAGGAQQAAPVVAGPPGKTVFARSCARCHGYRGEPLRSGTPALTPAKIAGLGDQVLALLVRSGKGEMPAFGALTDQQVADLIAYLRSIT